MVSYPSRALAIFAALHLIGGQWVVVQTAAWVGMFVEFSSTGSLEAALGKTFDGKHPCRFCFAVQKGTSEEKTPSSLKANARLEAVLTEELLIKEPDFKWLVLTGEPRFAAFRNDPPRLLPPRS